MTGDACQVWASNPFLVPLEGKPFGRVRLEGCKINLRANMHAILEIGLNFQSPLITANFFVLKRTRINGRYQ